MAGDGSSGAGSDGAPTDLPARHRIVYRVCLTVTAALVFARVVHYSTDGLPLAIDWVLGQALHYAIVGTSLASFVGPLYVLLVPVIALVLLVQLGLRRQLVLRIGDRIASPGWLSTIGWFGILVMNVMLDADPFVALACASMLLLLAAPLRRLLRIDAGGMGRVGAVWLLASVAWIATAPYEVTRRAVAVWCILLLLLATEGMRRLLPRDRLALALVAIIVVQFFARLPAGTPPGAVKLGSDGYAYHFCENTEHGKLYATVPCDWSYLVWNPPTETIEGCPYGYIAEHDLSDLETQTKHVFFDEDFDGRLVKLACTPDTVQATMVHSHIEGVSFGENVLEFEVEDPGVYERAILGDEVGNALVYDPQHDAVFYSSESNHWVFRLDRATGEVDRDVAEPIYGPFRRDGSIGSHHVDAGGRHETRDSVFVGQWATGSKIFEFSRATLELLETYDPMNGGNHGLAVDDELDRLWATSPWGVDVLQIPGGEVLGRVWLGAAIRNATIAHAHDLVFVSSTFTGRIWALDRRTLELLGSIPVGVECRQVEVSEDGRRLYGSNALGYYYWDIADLARQLRGDGA